MKYQIFICIIIRCILCEIIPIQFLQVSGGDPPQVKYYTINLALLF